VRIDGSTGLVQADPAQLQLVVHNVLMNAAQAMNGQGPVSITFRLPMAARRCRSPMAALACRRRCWNTRSASFFTTAAVALASTVAGQTDHRSARRRHPDRHSADRWHEGHVGAATDTLASVLLTHFSASNPRARTTYRLRSSGARGTRHLRAPRGQRPEIAALYFPTLRYP
jgi:hypothetical protein